MAQFPTVYERAVKEAAEEANLIKVDQASKKGDHIGPVVSKVQYDKIISLIQSGIDEGATLAAGGPELPNGMNKGYFIKPTIFTDVTNDMIVDKEEIFGPVLSIIPFETEEEAIKIVNETEYGLGNYVQTEDKEKAKEFLKNLRQVQFMLMVMVLIQERHLGVINNQGMDVKEECGDYMNS